MGSAESAMKSTVKLTYDSDHHVTASKEPQHKIIGIDCPYTGDGEEFSPFRTNSMPLTCAGSRTLPVSAR